MSHGWKVVCVSTWFQCLWFLSVVGQAPFQWLGISLAVLTVLATFKPLGMDLRDIVFITLAGLSIDSINVASGVLIFSVPVVPVWLVTLWLAFSWYANFLRSTLIQYPIFLVSTIGGIGGSLSYLAGIKLEAVNIGYPIPLTLAILFVEWWAIIWFVVRYKRLVEGVLKHDS
ncbi:hypothetical protein BCU70_04230 [Vibrio sp. 10N.286.49.C2]|uniref:DUF2878 domain-containing protein n=1 Tax=unclassified Vibrio TaxID=2614977 RepID=UPI000C828F7F|nr:MULTISPECIES: DUF2878 domain-containing protein [unclassified Vibrio]PMH33701.1 hypothetical protein BCU70_04230 [Vibrio sp. 10N.286.49.C2]PMH43958.1 hypothetical protein BCU66_03140 [Vibrio sp. 10N.286.49.B1]PMH78571.1 hypothetical protein BCU58_08795 [Vibrio sp. 10N.286.48.B7]